LPEGHGAPGVGQLLNVNNEKALRLKPQHRLDCASKVKDDQIHQLAKVLPIG
jgi:hypothetical protein